MIQLAETPSLFSFHDALPSGKLPSYIKDHRKRLRERFLDGGPNAVPDYELLELILFRAIPPQDVTLLARALIEQFGDFNRVIAAPLDQFRKVKGVGDAVVLEIKIVEAVAHQMAQSQVLERHVISNWNTLIKYCHTGRQSNFESFSSIPRTH